MSTRGRGAARQLDASNASGAEGPCTTGSQRGASKVGSGESPALWNRVVHGCSCRKSVAEVGKKHFPLFAEGRREASFGESQVARYGSSVLDEASFIVVSERVRGDCTRNVKGKRAAASLDRKSSIEPMEGVLVCEHRRPNPTATSRGPRPGGQAQSD